MKITFSSLLLAALAWGTPLQVSAAKKAATNNKFAGYLFAYFEGSGNKQEHLRFAISEDAKNWYALNDNQPVIASDSISTSGGIRDPHILRGEDGCYYIVATDMNTVKNGWKDNPGIVLMKSKDLVNWTHSKIVLKEDYKEHFSDAYWVWAPQTIYDKKAKKYMIYFTLQRTGDGRKSLVTYYAYANKDFTGFESEPKVLFNAKYGCIDNDIIERKGVYHMFYKGNIKNAEGKEIQNGIQQATAKNLKGPWKEDFKFIDAYADSKTGVEGSGVFKLNDKDEYVLMYDLYGSGRYEYQTSKDLNTFSTKPESFRKDFFPRHGTVCSVTKDEMERLQQKWGYVLNLSYTGKGNPILPGFHADPEILYSNKTGKYYIYSTTDGKPGWGGYKYYVYSSADLKEWKNEGVALDAKSDQIAWANGNLWAPAAIEVKQKNGSYKYYLYFSANPNDNGRKQMGVAVSDSPTGPFVDLGQPLLAKNHPGCNGQLIDVDVFMDPVSKKPYLYWGNSFMAGAELEPSMTKIKDETVTVMTPKGGSLRDYAYREAPYVFYRNGLYYFMWSVDDTGAANYHVAYGTSKSPLGPIEVAKDPIVLIQDPQHEIYGTAHNSVIQKPGTDEWYIVYHRINKDYIHFQPGVHREVCIDKLEFNADGTIKRVVPTHGGIQ
ncbi:glycoside hydrolase [Segatella hominis]|uniref:Glycoside hydrolase n=2 Tax=Segatella hominis TaxID=2518605 RepID=A0A4Y8V5P7_9BACT|nr:glycoside hydrolase [Segatella hominis]